MKSRKINFFVPISNFEKGTNKAGKEIYKIKGIASTDAFDMDGESLDPSGFDLSYFLNSGFFNYNHQARNNPDAIIGEPTLAKIDEKNELYLEGFLYGENPLVQKILKLDKNLKKYSKNRRIGFSIEGKATERDFHDKRKVTKAKITGCAVTPTPKNHNTWMDVVKGTDVEHEDQDYSFESDQGTVLIDDDYNLTVKALTTNSAQALIPESLEGNLKRAEFFKYLYKLTGNLKKSFNYLKKFKMSENLMNEFQEFQKFMELKKGAGESAESIESGNLKNKPGGASSMQIENDNIKKGDVEKYMKEMEKGVYGKMEEMEKGMDKRMCAVEKGMSEIKDMLKAITTNEEANGGQETIMSKGEDDDLLKSLLGEDDYSENDDLQKSITEAVTAATQPLLDRIESLEKAPIGRKSASHLGFLQKAVDENKEKHGPEAKTLSIRANRKEVSDTLFGLANVGAENQTPLQKSIQNAMETFEAAGVLDNTVRKYLGEKENIHIIG